jgi:hypothetical protein
MLVERPAIGPEECHDLAERLLERLVQPAGRHVDQACGELGQQRLEAQALFEVGTQGSARGAAMEEQRDQCRLHDDEKRYAEDLPRQ